MKKVAEALYREIEATEALAAEFDHKRGHSDCWSQTVRYGASLAPKALDEIGKLVRRHKALAAKLEGARGEYRLVLTERMTNLREEAYGWLNHPDIVTACGHDVFPAYQALEREFQHR
jgi:hypothetical protein